MIEILLSRRLAMQSVKRGSHRNSNRVYLLAAMLGEFFCSAGISEYDIAYDMDCIVVVLPNETAAVAFKLRFSDMII